jgi:transposase
MDEHRLGLLPVCKRVWSPKGQRPHAPVRRRYEWLYVYGFVRPTTGQSWWCLLPTVSRAAMRAALEAFVRDEGIDAEHRVVLVLDQAGSHTCPTLPVPEGLDLVFLPPYSPELAPAEHLWPLVDEVVVNQTVPTLDALEAVLIPRRQALTRQRPRLKSLTRYHWWPRERRPKRTK